MNGSKSVGGASFIDFQRAPCLMMTHELQRDWFRILAVIENEGTGVS